MIDGFTKIMLGLMARNGKILLSLKSCINPLAKVQQSEDFGDPNAKIEAHLILGKLSMVFRKKGT